MAHLESTIERAADDVPSAAGDHDTGFAGRAGALLRAAANDLKRDDVSAARDLGVSVSAFRDAVAGEVVDRELIARAASVWPINERDLLPIRDDTAGGVVMMTAAESAATARTIERGGRPYYEYRDTAMSRVASYRPEWIRMLAVVDDDRPDNAAVQWNRGHLLYQFTYFVGPVNYYFRWGARSRCLAMGTGDSVWGVPFAPHSFTSRSATEPALILALTYGDALTADAQRELAARDPDDVGRLALSPASATSGCVVDPALVRSLMQARALTLAALADTARMSADRASAIVSGRDEPSPGEWRRIAAALGVAPRELLPSVTRARDGVVVQRAADADEWAYPSPDDQRCVVRRLAADPLHPHTAGLELRLPSGGRPVTVATYQHQYVYVLDGALDIVIGASRWDDARNATLAAGDSMYAKPYADLSLRSPTGARVLVLRIGGAVTTDTRYQLGAMAPEGRDRYLAEDRLWYATTSETGDGVDAIG